MTIVYLLSTLLAVIVTDALAASRSYRQRQQDHLYELMLAITEADREHDRNIALSRQLIRRSNSDEFTEAEFNNVIQEFQNSNITLDEHFNKIYTITALFHSDLSQHLSKILRLTSPTIPKKLYEKDDLSAEEKFKLLLESVEDNKRDELKDEIENLFKMAAKKNKLLGKGYVHQLIESIKYKLDRRNK